MSAKLRLFIPITKIDEDNRIVHGAAAIEKLDRVGEVFDYATSKPYFEKWSGEIEKTSGGKSKGNVRAMHGRIAAGKLTDIHFDDDGKSIDVAAKIVDEAEWQKCLEGVYTGFSLGGSYVNKWKDKATKQTRYTADPAEISIVDFPCIPGATFEITKAAGDPETRPFKTPDAVELRARDLCKAAGGDPEDEVDHGAGNIVWKWTEFVSAARDAIAGETAAADPATAAVIADSANLGAIAPPPATKAAAADPPAAGVAVIKNETIATRASALAKAAGDETKWAGFIDQAHAELKTEAGAAARPPAHKETPSDDGSESQVWLHKRLPGQTFATKAEMRNALITLDAAEIAAAAVDPTLKALQEIRDGIAKLGPATLGPVRNTQDVASYTMLAKFMADQPGHELTKAAAAIGLPLAAEDGSSIEKPGPKETALREIITKVAAETAPKPFDLAKVAAITDAGAFKAACASLADQPLAETVRRTLRKRARTLGIAIADTPDGLMNRLEAPADLAKIAEGDLTKIATLSNVTTFLYLLESLERAEEALEMGPVADPYYSPYSLMTARIEVPKELRDRFGTLVVEMGDAVAELLDLILVAMKDEEASEALERAAPIVDLMKAGARHSKSDTTLLNGIHDASVKLGAACTTEKVQKAAPASEPAELEKVVEAQKTQFTKTISDLTTIIGDIGARLKTIEAQPAQNGAPQSLQIVDKTQDGGPLATPAGGDVDLNDPGVLKALGDLAIRAAHGRPHRMLGQ